MFSCFVPPFSSTSPIILEALDVAVGFQWGEEDVEEPQANEQHGGKGLRSPGPTQLSTNVWPPSVHQHGDTDKGKDGEECDRESQRARIYPELLTPAVVVDGSNGPRHLLNSSKTEFNNMRRATMYNKGNKSKYRLCQRRQMGVTDHTTCQSHTHSCRIKE